MKKFHATLRAGIAAILVATGGFAAADALGDARELYLSGQWEEALTVILPAAEAGHPRAQNIVGAAYQYGQGLPADPVAAERYFRMAADQGYPPALHNLGVLYERGMAGLQSDMAVARSWYERAAALDYGPSMGVLGGMYLEGTGGPADLVEAFRILDSGVRLGDRTAFEWLAYAHVQGLGTDPDLAEARRNYEIAAVMGSAFAQNAYGEMLERGEGGPQDLNLAMTFYRRAIAGDEAYAGVNAAWLVFENPEVFPDRVDGMAYCLWAVEAAEGADREEYREACDIEAEGMSEADLRLARKRAEGL